MRGWRMDPELVKVEVPSLVIDWFAAPEAAQQIDALVKTSRRSPIGTPAAKKSSAYSPPAPTPMMRRPPQDRSISASCLAATAGGYEGRTRVAVPIMAWRLCSASRASQTIGSGDGLGEARCPPTQSESMPRPSSSRTASPVAGATVPIETALPEDSDSVRAVYDFTVRRHHQTDVGARGNEPGRRDRRRFVRLVEWL